MKHSAEEVLVRKNYANKLKEIFREDGTIFPRIAEILNTGLVILFLWLLNKFEPWKINMKFHFDLTAFIILLHLTT